MQRRNFVKLSMLSAPSLMLAQTTQASETRAVSAGTDILGEEHSLGFSKIFFKTTAAETNGGMFVMEHNNLAKGGRSSPCVPATPS